MSEHELSTKGMNVVIVFISIIFHRFCWNCPSRWWTDELLVLFFHIFCIYENRLVIF
jgi:hypothetical protein